MKKLTLTLLFLSAPVWAMETATDADSGSTHNIGVHAGVNVTNADLASGDSGTYAGWTVGLSSRAALVPGVLYIAPEFNFLRIGAENNAFGGLATTRLDYLELPLLLRAELPVGAVRPYILAGPRLTYLIGSNTEAAGVSVDTGDFNDFGVGAYVGAGLGLEIGGLRTNISARYLFDLTDLRDDGQGEWRNRGVQFLLGVMI